MKKVSLSISAALILLSAYVFMTALAYPPSRGGVPGPGVFPRAITCILFLLAIVNVIREVGSSSRPSPESGRISPADLRRVLGGGVFTIAYFVAMYLIGFVVSTPLYLFSIMFYYQVRNKAVLFLLPLAVMGSLYGTFYLFLDVPLPAGLLFD